MSQAVYKALEILLIVIMYSSSWFIGWASIMGVSALWKKMKREADKEKKEHEAIIVKRNDRKAQLDKEIKEKEAKLIELNKKLGIEEPVVEEPQAEEIIDASDQEKDTAEKKPKTRKKKS